MKLKLKQKSKLNLRLNVKLKLDCFNMEMYSNRRPQPIGFGVEIKFELGTYLN